MEKELGFGEISSKKNWKQVFFLKSCMHFSDTVLALGIYVYVYIFCKQLCQQKTSHLDIVTISRQYRAASRQWLLSNNIVQDLALACPTYSICLLGNSGKDYQYITTVLTDAALMAWKSGHCSLT